MNFFNWAMTPEGFDYISRAFIAFGLVIFVVGMFGDRLLNRWRKR